MTFCENCSLRPGTELWVGHGGVLDHVHGLSRRWCRQCVVEAQLTHARAAADRIPALQAELEELRTR